MTAQLYDPFASASGQFPLAAPHDAPPSSDIPSPVGLRPWGLRGLTDVNSGVVASEPVRYDHTLQLAVNSIGTPLITMADPTADTTSTTDGEDPPSSEDWTNDFAPDQPYQP